MDVQIRFPRTPIKGCLMLVYHTWGESVKGRIPGVLLRSE